MYAYCQNNPIMYADPSGKIFDKNDLIKILDDVLKAKKEHESLDIKIIAAAIVVEHYYLNNYVENTISVGFNLAYASGIGGAVSLQLAADHDGNVAFSYTFVWGGGSPNLSATFVLSEYDVSIDNLIGRNLQTVGSILGIGIEKVFFIDNDGGTGHGGISFMAGVGLVPAEGHGEYGRTDPIGKNFYIIDLTIDVLDFIF